MLRTFCNNIDNVVAH